MALTQKETDLLKDLKEVEKLCIEKYQKHASCANDPELKNMLSSFSAVEQEHLKTLDQIGASGAAPSMAPGGPQAMSPTAQAYYTAGADEQKKQDDAYLCSDLLASEKHSSGVYDTCIFEFKDVGIRGALNHIQKEEQEHGEKLYAYMAKNGMYN